MSKGQGKVGAAKSATTASIPLACTCEVAAREFLEKRRWGGCACCPHCGSSNVYTMRDSKTGERERFGRWRCRDCKRQFSVRTGTVMEESRIPLTAWVLAFWRMTSSRKGVSAMELHRVTGLSYRSAHFLAHRVRFALTTQNPTLLHGVIEADETFVGGKPRVSISQDPVAVRAAGGSNYQSKPDRKTPVFAALHREGEVRARVLTSVDGANIMNAIRSTITRGSALITDESRMYTEPGRQQDGGHHTVCHSKKEYARGHVTTNRVENFFSHLKRTIIGVHHAVSRKHLHRYVSAAEFNWNHRQLDDGDRVNSAIAMASFKRLTYKQQVGRS